MASITAIIYVFLLAVTVLGGVCGFFFSSDGKWDDLKTTWGINPFSSTYFDDQPRTEQDALKEGFVFIGGCTQKPSWRGRRYIKSGDYAIVLLYDVNGYIAGIQTGFPKNLSNGFPSQAMMKYFIEDGDHYFATAYFVRPDLICSEGRTPGNFAEQGTGTNLYFQQGTDPNASILMPRSENSLKGTEWVEGKCFVTMGKHYWYKFTEETSCSDYFPLFLMYNDGLLTAFGWALAANLESSRFEHPTPRTFRLFMKRVPRCLYDIGTLSTMHIFLSDSIMRNTC